MPYLHAAYLQAWKQTAKTQSKTWEDAIQMGGLVIYFKISTVIQLVIVLPGRLLSVATGWPARPPTIAFNLSS